MRLLSYEGFKVVIAPEALGLKPFRTLWNRDRSRSKDKAITELSYIYFFSDPRSEYQYIIDDDERDAAVKEGLGLSPKWKPDKEVVAAMELYGSFTTTAALLLKDTRYVVDKFRKMLRETNLDERDKNGKPLYALNSITDAINKVPILVQNLDKAEKQLNEQLKEDGNAVGNAEMSILDSEF